MADVPYRAQQVVSTCQSQCQKSKLTLTSTGTFRDSLMESTPHLEELLDEKQVGHVRRIGCLSYAFQKGASSFDLQAGADHMHQTMKIKGLQMYG